MNNNELIVGIDIGGTNTAYGLIDNTKMKLIGIGIGAPNANYNRGTMKEFSC